MGEQLAEEAPARRTRAPGERSRARILEQAARLATIEGLAGLSVGGLAEATGMAKSSVYALFGSKEELQLATIDAARDSFIRGSSGGVARLWDGSRCRTTDAAQQQLR
jgi:AcrR family transcriptional regulator